MRKRMKMNTQSRTGFLFLGFFLTFMSARAGDWPMWRHDTLRSGVTTEELGEKLVLQWSRDVAPAKVAWPNESRLHFDSSIEPIVKGKRMFVGSPVNGSVTAYDTDSGQELWRFYSDGPVRFAPVAWMSTVCFGSDDGYLYSVDALTGKLRWKARGAPDKRADYRQLGNNRLVSLWPVRGGPVIQDGVVYFGAGIWPSMGVFVKAVDADTGEVKWANGDINYLSKVRIDHNVLAEAALSPQGYCLFADGKVVVPNGRSMPARFDPKTGELFYFVQGYRHGDSRVTSNGRLLFVGEQGVVSLTDGREVGDRWASAGDKAPNGWSSRRDLFEGPFYEYKFMPGCDFRSVFDKGVAYGMGKGFLHGWDVQKAETSLYEKKVGETTIHPARWDAPPVWDRRQLTRTGARRSRVIIKAGRQIYTHVDKTLFALSTAGKAEQPKVAWQQELSGTPSSMLVADGKLFVVLAEGKIQCFGVDQPKEITRHPLPKSGLGARGRDVNWAIQAKQALDAAATDEGYALVIGLESGFLADELLSQSKMKVIAIDADAAKINSLRSRIIETGLYGSRFEAITVDPATVKLPPYLASLIVSETGFDQNRLKPADFYQSLRPYGGILVAYGVKWGTAELAKPKFPGAAIWQRQQQTCVRREGALEGAADWTHESGDAARVFFSSDQLVQAPLGILWYGDGPNHGYEKRKDYGRGVKPEVAEGRLVAFDDAEKELKAIDIYTGRLLWKRKTPSAIVRMVTFPDAVYVASGLKCEVLDPATGEVVRSLPLRIEATTEEKPGVVAVRATDDLLLIAIGFNLPESHHSHSAMDHGLWDAKILVGLDRKTGEQLWTRRAEHRFNLHSIVIGDGMVFTADSISPVVVDKAKRRGVSKDAYESKTIAVDGRTGKVRWQKTYSYKYRTMTGRGPLAIRPYDDWQAYNERYGILLAGKSSEVRAIDVKTGEVKWHSTSAGIQPLILSDYDFINQSGHKYEVETGKLLSKKPLFTRGACNYTVGSDSLLFLRYKSAAYVDLNKSQKFSLRNLRSGCSNSLVAAGGLLNVPCFSTGCVCNYPLQTSFSMYHMPETGEWAGDEPLEVSTSGKAK
jgi:outer membrane protein assembly factor BamB